MALIRMYLKKSIALLLNNFPESNPEVFVDDTSMHAYNDTFEEVLQDVIPSVAKFGDEVRVMGLSLSPKAVCTASSKKLATAAKNELASYGMTFKVDPDARDV